MHQQPINFKTLPKVVLHDHLDGGLRPDTLIELAAEIGLNLPSDDPALLANIIAESSNGSSLDAYLQAFGWTVPVMQTSQSIRRVAYEAVIDLAADGVVLAELRFAPLLHTQRGLTVAEVVLAASEGVRDGADEAGIPCGLILCAMRHQDHFQEIVDIFRNSGNDVIVGLDLAGPELGHPVERHLGPGRLLRDADGISITIHAGEADDASSIQRAIDCGADRIGHGTRLIDDILSSRSVLRSITGNATHIEVCLSSNVHTGAVRSMLSHPLRTFIQEGISVSLNADNRLMSATCASKEYEIGHTNFGLTKEELLTITYNGIRASFLSEEKRNQAFDLAARKMILR